MKHNKKQSWHFDVEINPQDKLRLKQTFINETYLYNLIIESFASNLNSRPEVFLKYNGEYEHLFGYAAENSISLRQIKKMKELPEKLKKSEQLIKSLDETTLILFDPVKWRSNLSPSTKREMAKAILKYYVDQAKIKAQKGNKDNVYRSNFFPLQKVDTYQKRHVQLLRQDVSIHFNVKENRTEIKVPYILHPIIIQNKNIFDMNMDWNLMVIHQEPGKIPALNDPWIVEFRKTDTLYLIKYLEMANLGYSSFKAASRGREAVPTSAHDDRR